MKVAVRGSRGLTLAPGGPPHYGQGGPPPVDLDGSGTCKAMTFSRDGALMAWCNGQTVKIAKVQSKDGKDGPTSIQEVANLPAAKKAVFLSFSPKGTHLATWEVYAVPAAAASGGKAGPADEARDAEDKSKKNSPQNPNFRMWNVATGQAVYSCVQRLRDGWAPQWTLDEAVCCFRGHNNEALFFEGLAFDRPPRARLSLPKLNSFSMSGAEVVSACGGAATWPRVVGFLPAQKGGPGFAKMFCFPEFHPEKGVVGSKSFMTCCDRIEAKWSPDGRSVLLLATADVDKTGGSYYGKTQLHYMDASGEGALVGLAKDGPVYSVEWSPAMESNFAVVYGYMPAKATLFNRKCQPMADFGCGPRNLAMFNPQGTLLYLGGFGNLSGQTEVWDLASKRKVAEFATTDATDVRWSPDGQHLLAATCAPRLRQNNGYSVWHYTGSLMLEHRYSTTDPKEELWEVAWQPGHYPSTFPILDKPVSGGLKSSQPEASKEVYRPPGARGGVASILNFHRDDYNETQELPGSKKDLSKSQVKKLKKKTKKQQGGEAGGESPEKPAEKATVVDEEAAKAKRLRKLNDKLFAIEKLKQKRQEGQTLDEAQLKKVGEEEQTLAEIRALSI